MVITKAGRMDDRSCRWNGSTGEEALGVAKKNFEAFKEMKDSLVGKRESTCSMEDMAMRLGCTVDDVAEFEQYWSDPTISEVQEYALALMSAIQIGTNDYDNGFKPYYRAIVPCPAIVETVDSIM